jgi:hypothetical protein
MWYYEVNHQPVGPVSEEAIADLLRARTIDALTLVWQEGMSDWKHLGETELNEMSRHLSPAAPAVLMPNLSQPNGFPFPRVEAAAPTVSSAVPRVRSQSLKRVFTWWAGSMAFVALYQLFAGLFPDSSILVTLSCLAEVVVIYYTVMQFVLLFNFWRIDQDGAASTTPGKAVGFLFIPFFNIYWVFRAYTGLALDQNRYSKAHFADRPETAVRKAHPIFSLLLFAATIAGGYFVYLPMFSKLYASNMTTFDINTYNNLLTQFNTPLTIFTLVSMVFLFLMFLDFYLTAKSILEAEEKR